MAGQIRVARHMLGEAWTAPALRSAALHQAMGLVTGGEITSDEEITLTYVIASDEVPEVPDVVSIGLGLPGNESPSAAEVARYLWERRRDGFNRAEEQSGQLVSVNVISQGLSFGIEAVLQGSGPENHAKVCEVFSAFADQSWAAGFMTGDHELVQVLASQIMAGPYLIARPGTDEDNPGESMPVQDDAFRLLSILLASDEDFPMLPEPPAASAGTS